MGGVLAVVAIIAVGAVTTEPVAADPVVAPGLFAPVEPTRVLDTRNGIGAPKTQVPAGRSLTIQVAGARQSPLVPDSVPASVAAVVLNLTVTRAAAPGYVTAYPEGESRPGASSINFVGGRTIANAVTVKVGVDGGVSFHNGSTRPVDLIVDIAGWYAAGAAQEPGAFTPLSPKRLLDTRNQAAVPAGQSIDLKVLGTSGGAPASGAGAVMLNVTVTRPAGGGYVSAYARGATRPGASNVNFVPGQTIANAVTTRVSASGEITLYNGASGPVHLIVDIGGWIAAGAPTAPGALSVVNPARLLDTRNAVGVPGRTAVASGASVSFQVTGRGAIPANVQAVVLNLTVTRQAAGGYATAFPGQSAPNASSINFVAGETVANQVTVKLAAGGRVSIVNGSPQPVHLIADVSASYAAPPSETPRIERVSVSSAGAQSSGNATVHDITPNGRFVLFESTAGDLDPTSVVASGEPLLYVRDTQLATTDLVNVAAGGAAPNGTSNAATISDDGNLVAFASAASNLVAGDTAGTFDVFVRDRSASTTTRIVGNTGAALNAQAAAPQLSGNGAYVAFETSATNVVPGNVEPATASDVYRWNRSTRLSEVVPDHPTVDGQESQASISTNGNRVAFISYAPLVAADTNDVADVYVHDFSARTTTWISRPASGTAALGSFHPEISGDGTRVAWRSQAALVGGDSNAGSDVFVRDAGAAAPIIRASVDLPGVAAWDVYGALTISSNGGHVAYKADVGSAAPQSFVASLSATAVTQTREVTGLGADASEPVVNGDGTAVAFTSTSSTLVTGDTNGRADAFVRRFG